MPRPELHPGVGVGVFIFRDGKFLMLQRQGAHGSGTWSVPGGWMEFGESFEDSSEREVLEETDLKVSNLRFGALTSDVFKDEGVHSLTVWMMSDFLSGEAKIMETNKCSNMGWFDFDSLPEPLFLPWVNLKQSQFYDNLKQELAKSKKVG
jgi:8-oxo-dGTP diphosphatase